MSAIYFGTNQTAVAPGSTFDVGVFVDTDGFDINAVEGVVTFPSAFADVVAVSDGNSIVSLWVERPKAKCEAQCRVPFAGIFPGGFNGNDAPIFKIVLRAKQEGSYQLTVEEERVLLNDGLGTETEVREAPLTLAVSEEAGTVGEVGEVEDDVPPEPFAPVVGQSTDVFRGAPFVSFATQDKQSGLDHYEVRESRPFFHTVLGKWVEAESPYRLNDTDLQSTIEVKAIDRAGNERLAELGPTYPLSWYENPTVWGIMLPVIVVGSFVIWACRKKHVC
jgi:hypothetical protein